MTMSLFDEFVGYALLTSLKKVVSDTIEDFVAKMKLKDKKTEHIEKQYKSLAQNGWIS